MRRLTILILLILQWSTLFAAAGRAVSSSACLNISREMNSARTAGEITSNWESKSDRELMGYRVLSDLRNHREQSLGINAFCSSVSIEKIIQLRKITVDVIVSHASTGEFDSAVSVASEILPMIARVAFTPLTDNERKLISSASILNSYAYVHMNKGLSSENIPLKEYADSAPGVTSPAPSLQKLKLCEDKKYSVKYSSKNLQCRKILYDNDFADLYKLFFYVRDNSGNGKAFYITYNIFPCNTIQPQCNLIRYKNTSKADTRILLTGAPS